MKAVAWMLFLGYRLGVRPESIRISKTANSIPPARTNNYKCFINTPNQRCHTLDNSTELVRKVQVLVTNWYYQFRFCNYKIRRITNSHIFLVPIVYKTEKMQRSKCGYWAKVRCYLFYKMSRPARLWGPPSLLFKGALPMAIKRRECA